MSQNALRHELDHATQAAGLPRVIDACRHTDATALVNAGVSLQALMALLGHVSAEMSLRYGRLFRRDCARLNTNAHWTRPSATRTGANPKRHPATASTFP
jgi:site-specific recombinase XerD